MEQVKHDRDNIPRSLKWKLADRLREERLAYVNAQCEEVIFRETIYTKYVKRVLDILISGFALLVTLPINLTVAIVTFFDVGRPIIFSQERIGKGMRLFDLIKFRNMTNEKDENGELLPPHMRVTRWGKFVRKTSIDELMNFWSILKGDMSIVGPRPMPEPYLKRFSNRHLARFNVRPGLECPPKDMSFNIRTWNDQFENDIWYVENVSFATDIKMVMKLFRLAFDRKYSEVRGQAKRGDFLGYSMDGKAISQYDLTEEYLDWVYEGYGTVHASSRSEVA